MSDGLTPICDTQPEACVYEHLGGPPVTLDPRNVFAVQVYQHGTRLGLATVLGLLELPAGLYHRWNLIEKLALLAEWDREETPQPSRDMQQLISLLRRQPHDPNLY